MRAQKQTNPDILKIAVIAHIKEWEELIEYLDDDGDDNSIIQGFAKIFKDIVIHGRKESHQRSVIETNNDR